MHKVRTPRRARVAAAGFFALDIVFGIDDPVPRLYAGGTCGNVLAGLAFLGWEASPIARLAHDVAGDFVQQDLEQWGVNTKLLRLAPLAATPIVLEKIHLSKNGIPLHRFLWNCPDCSSYFPAFRAVLRTQVEYVKEAMTCPNVFFVDRVSRSTIELARHFGKKGSLIYFEPSAAGDGKLFREMLQVCDVLKYSAQRARSFSELLREHRAHLEIETLGEDGLRFRTRNSFGSWCSVPACEVKVKDAAGAGDWTSVGLISALFAKGKCGLGTASKQDIASALEHAQAAAALNCQFEGSRGAMYYLTRSRFIQAVAALEAKNPGGQKPHRLSLVKYLSTSAVCPSCSLNGFSLPKLNSKSDQHVANFDSPLT
ncbi:MAG: carbohydrate kinase family protein [Candidatus Binatia bacterium]